MKKRFYLTFLGMLLCSNSQALEIRHLNTVFANQGMCSAEFFLNGGIEEKQDVQIMLDLLVRGVKVKNFMLSISNIGDSEANRYKTAFIEHEALCDDETNMVFVLKSATAIVDGKRVDLLKQKEIDIVKFKPIPIKLK